MVELFSVPRVNRVVGEYGFKSGMGFDIKVVDDKGERYNLGSSKSHSEVI